MLRILADQQADERRGGGGIRRAPAQNALDGPRQQFGQGRGPAQIHPLGQSDEALALVFQQRVQIWPDDQRDELVRDLDLKGGRSFQALVCFIILALLVISNPPVMLFLIAMIYVSSGPIESLFKGTRKAAAFAATQAREKRLSRERDERP